MAAAASDRFSKTSSGDIAVIATVTTPRATGVTSLAVDTQLNWPTDTGVKFSTYKVDSSGVKSSQTDWRGVSNGTNTLTNIARTGGVIDTGNAVGDKVVMIITAGWGEDLVEGLLTSMSQTGALLPSAVQTAIGNAGILASNLAAGSVTTTAIADGTIAAQDLSPSAITLGYVPITSTFTSRSTTPVQVTGLTSTVTIPAGGRNVRVTVFCPNAYAMGTAARFHISIWDGVVGTGTKLQDAGPSTQPNAPIPANVSAILVAPTAGSKTFNVGFSSENGGVDCTLESNATAPSYLQVEVV